MQRGLRGLPIGPNCADRSEPGSRERPAFSRNGPKPARAYSGNSQIGDGYATPAVVGGRLYVLGNRGMENEFVQALSGAGRQDDLDDAPRAMSESQSGAALSDGPVHTHS